MEFSSVHLTETEKEFTQVLVSTGRQTYRIYRTTSSKKNRFQTVRVTRRAPSGEKTVWPVFSITDNSPLTSLVLMNDIRELLKFIPDNAPLSVIKHAMTELAGRYNVLSGHESRPYCKIGGEQLITHVVFSREMHMKLKSVAQILGVFPTGGA